MSKYLEYIPESSSGDGKTVTVIRLYKATYHGLHGDVLPIVALDYSGIAEMVRSRDWFESSALNMTHG